MLDFIPLAELESGWGVVFSEKQEGVACFYDIWLLTFFFFLPMSVRSSGHQHPRASHDTWQQRGVEQTANTLTLSPCQRSLQMPLDGQTFH